MIALVVIGLAAIIAIAVAWSRVGLARSERRSMQSHEHTLQVLGDVTKRSDAAARVTRVPPERATYGHIRTEHAAGAARAEERSARPPSHATPAQPWARPRIEIPAVPTRFEDVGDAVERQRRNEEEEALSPFGSGEPAEPPRSLPARASRPKAPPRPVARRRLATVLAGMAVLAGVAVGGLRLAASPKAPAAAAGGHHHPSGHPSAASHKKAKAQHSPHRAPSALVPVSTSPSEVAFVAPKGSYTVSLLDSGGTCWVGIQQTSGGPYVWQETLSDGESATYKASGPLVIRIGAPRYLGVKVNGLPARLPGYVQPYDLLFNPSSPPSSA